MNKIVALGFTLALVSAIGSTQPRMEAWTSCTLYLCALAMSFLIFFAWK